jgi:hypothetical protein
VVSTTCRGTASASSGTLQSLPGPQIVATNVYNNANRAALTTLARPFTNAQATINTIEPASAYGDRLNQIDLRFTKIVNVGHGRDRLQRRPLQRVQLGRGHWRDRARSVRCGACRPRSFSRAS